jgi:hypothetical protein
LQRSLSHLPCFPKPVKCRSGEEDLIAVAKRKDVPIWEPVRVLVEIERLTFEFD